MLNIINLYTLIRKVHISLKDTKVYKSLVLVIIFIFIFSTLFYFCESGSNENIKSIGDSLWWGFVTSTTVGYGDIYPVTGLGRLIAVNVMIIGIGIFGFITASVASILVERNLKKGMGLLDVNFKGHIIIIGWNYRSKSIIEELLNEDQDIQITLIDNIEQNPYNSKNVSYIKGEAWNDKVLSRANVKEAKIALVLADKKLDDQELIDAKSVLICLAIDRINPDILLVAEVINHTNTVHFERANVNDIIVSNQIESKVLVRSILYKGVNLALKELITNSYGNELYQIPIEKNLVGKKYGEIVIEFLQKNITIIGFLRNNKAIINPSKDTFAEENDELVYIARKKLD